MIFPLGGWGSAKPKPSEILTRLQSKVPSGNFFYYNPSNYDDDWKELLQQAEEIMQSPGSVKTSGKKDPRTKEQKIQNIISGLVAEYGLRREMILEKNPKYLESDLLLPINHGRIRRTIEVKNISIYQDLLHMSFGNNNKSIIDGAKFIRESKKVVDALIITSRDRERREDGAYKIYIRKLIDGYTFFPWHNNKSGLIYKSQKPGMKGDYFYADKKAVERGQCIIFHPRLPVPAPKDLNLGGGHVFYV
jgi:hypothetical protein